MIVFLSMRQINQERLSSLCFHLTEPIHFNTQITYIIEESRGPFTLVVSFDVFACRQGDFRRPQLVTPENEKNETETLILSTPGTLIMIVEVIASDAPLPA